MSSWLRFGLVVVGGLVAQLAASAEPPGANGISPEQQDLIDAYLRDPTEEATRSKLIEAMNAEITACEADRQTPAETDGSCSAAVQLSEALLGPEHPDVAMRLNELGAELMARRAYQEAEPVLARAVAIAEAAHGPNHPDVGSYLRSLARVAALSGRYAEAETAYRRVLAIREAARGPDHPRVATSLTDLATLLRTTGRFEEAEPLLRRALAIREKVLGRRHPDIAASLDALAGLLVMTGEYAEAEPLFRRALAISEAALGPTHPSVASNLGNLASLLDAIGEYAEAGRLHRRTLEILENAFGPNHPYVAFTCTNLANLSKKTGDYPEAEGLYRRSLGLLEAALGPEHPNVATVLDNLPGLLQTTEKWEEAEPTFRRALAIRERALGSDHPLVAQSIDNLGLAVTDLGNYAEAESLHRRALVIREATLGPDHRLVAASVHHLGSVRKLRGDLTEAEQLHRRALALREAALGPDHPEVARSLQALAVLLQTAGADAEAEPLYRRAIAINEAALGPQHLAVSVSLNSLGILMSRAADFEEAESLLRRALAISEAKRGPNHPEGAKILNNLAALFALTEAYEEAEALYRRALAIREATLGRRHPDVAASLTSLGRLALVSGELRRAEPLLTEALAIREASLGTAHPHRAESLVNLGALYRAMERPLDVLPLLGEALDVEETVLARDLLATTPLRSRLRLAAFQASTDAIVSQSLATYPDAPAARRRALETLLRRKGRLVDLERSTVRRIRENADEEGLALLARLERQTAYLGQLQERIPVGDAELRAWRESREKVADEVEVLRRDLASRSAVYAEAAKTITVDVVASALAPNSGLLEFATYRPWLPTSREEAPRRYAAYLLTPDGKVSAFDVGPAAEVDGQIRSLRRALLEQTPLVSAAEEVFAQAVGPLAEELGRLTHLYVSADGLLNLVPFDVLLDAQPKLERLSVSYLTSGRDLLQEHEKTVSRDAWVIYDVDYDNAERDGMAEGAAPDQAFWGPLPGTLDEGRAIVRRLRRAKALTRSSATESATRELNRPYVLHVASHGYFRTRTAAGPNPSFVTRSQALRPDVGSRPLEGHLAEGEHPLFRSGLVLAGANLPAVGRDNGLLTAAELADLDLRGTQLVVLSACETGTGEIRTGDGVLGLRRAVVLAGARAQIVSLWRVDDEATAALMKELYRQLRRGKTVAEAMALARAEVRRRPKWAHPFYWAAFTISGDASVRLSP